MDPIKRKKVNYRSLTQITSYRIILRKTTNCSPTVITMVATVINKKNFLRPFSKHISLSVIYINYTLTICTNSHISHVPSPPPLSNPYPPRLFSTLAFTCVSILTINDRPIQTMTKTILEK